MGKKGEKKRNVIERLKWQIIKQLMFRVANYRLQC